MKGIGTSPGIAIGKAFIYKLPEMNIEKTQIDNIEEEIKKFDAAIERVHEEIEELYNLALNTLGKSNAEIFSSHLMILDDPEFYKEVVARIEDEWVCCQWAVRDTAQYFMSLFEGIEDEYLKARVLDIKDVTERILRNLLGLKSMDLSTLSKDSIIIAEELTPSDTIHLNKDRVAGFITELGGKTSHSAIMARTFEIPAITGVQFILSVVTDGDIVLMDGSSGEIIISPDEEELVEYRKKISAINQEKDLLRSMKGLETISRDGVRVELAGNIGSTSEIDQVILNDGEGVGLFRTEFLFMDKKSCPTEEDQFLAYKEAAQKLGNKPLIIRTLDIGGDKELFYLNLPKEMNPFLGYRAIRLCLDQEDMFKVQLRAILRASHYGNVKVMLPMISSIKEISETKKLIKKIKKELIEENIPFRDDIEIGIMVEVPAVAIQSRRFAKEVDFFSIGTNDLIQYTLAVDRGNQKLAGLYNQYHPAVLSLIKSTVDNAHEEGIWVGMCGEMAGDEKLIPILLGMGIDELSMSPSSILKARYIIRNSSQADLRLHLDRILDLATAEEVEEYLVEKLAVKSL